MFDPSAIDQILLLAKNARGEISIVGLVSDALARPDLFVFGEIIDLPIVQEVNACSRLSRIRPHVAQLKDSDGFRDWYKALELFAYGTLQDYRSEKDERTIPGIAVGYRLYGDVS